MKRNYNKKRETYFQIHGKFLLSLPIEFQNCLYSPNSHISIDEDGLYQILEDIRQGHASEKSDYTFFNTSYSFKITDMENTQDTIYLDLEFQGDRINIE